jgi:hypothetical protein
VHAHGVSAAIAVDDPELEAYWRRWLEPFFVVERLAEPAPASWSLEVTVGAPVAADRPAREGRPVTLHSEQRGTAFADDEGVEHVARDDGLAAYELDRAARRLRLRYAGEQARAAALDSLQVVRGVLVDELEARGWMRLHAAIVALDGKGVALIGPKGSGKTSFLLGALAHVECDYVTNDKCLVRAGPDRTWEAIALPYAVAAPPPAVDELSAAFSRIADRRTMNGKVYVWPQDLAQALDRPIEWRVTLGAVAACEFDLAAPGIETAWGREELVPPGTREAALSTRDRVTPEWALGDTHAAAPEAYAPFFRSLEHGRIGGNPWRDEGWSRFARFLREL